MYTIYINNTLPPALAVHEIYRDIFGPPMVKLDIDSLNPLQFLVISLYTYIIRARMFRSLIIRTGIKERNILARNITI